MKTDVGKGIFHFYDILGVKENAEQQGQEIGSQKKTKGVKVGGGRGGRRDSTLFFVAWCSSSKDSFFFLGKQSLVAAKLFPGFGKESLVIAASQSTLWSKWLTRSASYDKR